MLPGRAAVAGPRSSRGHHRFQHSAGKHRVDNGPTAAACRSLSRPAGSLAEATLQAYKDGPATEKSGRPDHCTSIAGVALTSGAVSVRVPAKINLQLAVGPLRPDGFHEIGTVFAALELTDLLTAT
ncbi:MAG: 4-diphosphocytidyl-2-C-methyl-D-erythritol kinase, partial [Pseudonocardiales bacterium]|nr:4-diphosphocytidyl-2-C-methyl-D-erythritol kinase [Pseudonocardiales bacterium]